MRSRRVRVCRLSPSMHYSSAQTALDAAKHNVHVSRYEGGKHGNALKTGGGARDWHVFTHGTGPRRGEGLNCRRDETLSFHPPPPPQACDRLFTVKLHLEQRRLPIEAPEPNRDVTTMQAAVALISVFPLSGKVFPFCPLMVAEC